MNTPDPPARPPKRHYVPVLPMPRPDTLQSAKRAQLRANRQRRTAKKLDEVLGSVEDDL